jgi:hypothetical protein
MLALLLLAAEALTPKPPAIPPKLEAAYWRAETLRVVAQYEATAKAEASKALLEKLKTACGPDHQVVDRDGLQCVPNPQK